MTCPDVLAKAPEGVPIKLAPKSYESIAGYVLRLSEANFYPLPGWVYGLLVEQDPSPSFSYFFEVAKKLPALVGARGDAFLHIAYRPTPAKNRSSVFAFGDHVINVREFLLKSPQVCPHCVEEYGVVLSLWDFKSFLACPRHKCLMVSRCGTCDAGLSWFRPGLLICHKCKSEIFTGETEPANKAVWQLAALIASKSVVPSDFCEDWNSTVWEEEDLDNLLANISFLGRFASGDISGYGNWGRDQLLNVMGELTPVFLDWPRSYEKYLEGIMLKDVKSNMAFSTGLVAAFGRFYKAVTSDDRFGRHRLLKQGLSDYVMKSLDPSLVSGRGQSVVYSTAAKEVAFMTKEETKARLHISSDTFDRLFKAGILKGHMLRQRKQRIYRVHSESILAYERKERAVIDRKGLERSLGISRPLVDKLLATGHLAVSQRPGIDGATKWLVEAEAVEQLFHRIDCSYAPVFIPTSWYLDFVSLYHAAANRGLPGPEFLAAVLNGKIPARYVDRSKTSLGRYYFTYWDLFLCSADPNLRIDKAAAVLGTSEGAINWLVKRGYLETRIDKANDVIRITARSIMKFAESFVSFPMLKIWSGNEQEARRFRRRLFSSDQLGASQLKDKFISTERAIQFLINPKLPKKGSGTLHPEVFQDEH